MARETRRQRRDQKKAGPEAKPVAQRARQRQAQVRPATQPVAQQTGRRGERERGRFVKEAWGELKKVEWPGRAQVIQGTIVVLIACIIVGIFLYAADQTFKPLVRNILLGQ